MAKRSLAAKHQEADEQNIDLFHRIRSGCALSLAEYVRAEELLAASLPLEMKRTPGFGGLAPSELPAGEEIRISSRL
jgi:hypothetical protein